MDNSDPWDSVLNPVENRLSNYKLSPADGNVSCTHADDGYNRSFSGQDCGESSSATVNLQDGAFSDDLKTRLGWPSSYTSCIGSGARSGDWSFEPPSSSSYSGRVQGMHSYISNRGSLYVSPEHGHSREHDGHRGITTDLPHNLCKSGYSEMEQGQTFYASSGNVGTSLGSSSTFTELNDASGPSSCKRKAFEGTSEQFCAGESSSSTRPMGKNVLQHSVPDCYPCPVNLSISSGTSGSSPTDHLEQLNPSICTGTGRRSSFPSSSVPGTGESSARNFSIRSNHGRHEPVPFDTPRGTSVRHVGTGSALQSRPISNTDSSELRLPTLLPMSLNVNQPYPVRVTESRGFNPYPWDGYFGSRGGNSSGSFTISGERGSEAREEANARSSSRNNLEHLMAVTAPETRHILQDQIDWSFAPRASASSRDQSSSLRHGLGPGGQPSSSAWLPHENQALQNHQVSETPPWIPFAHVESESGNRRRHFTPLTSTSSSPDEGASTSRAQNQLRQSSAPFFMDIPGDDIGGLRALAAVEGRHRMIRQVLNAMRRGVQLRAEDYMLIDPFIDGIAELHDRHRDMRLDVDNMSYEELLALEERMGNVSTGLSEEKIMGLMKGRKHTMVKASPNLEPCCICQENFFAGDNIGILDCGHEFHTYCIKQWLTLKNLCPVCKTVALNT